MVYDRTALVMAADRLAAEDAERRAYLDREIAAETRTVKVPSPEVCPRGHSGRWRARITRGHSVRYCAACAHLNDSAERRRRRKEGTDGR